MMERKIIEVGQFVMMARVYPKLSHWYWTGRQNPTPLARKQVRVTATGRQELKCELNSPCLNSHSKQTAFVHVPIRTRFLPARNVVRMMHNDFAGMAYADVIRQTQTPVVGLDMNDGAELSKTALAILEKSVCFFKRELTIDPDRMLFSGATSRHREILHRNLHKMFPISLGLCSARESELPSLIPEKRHDLFFAGGLTSEHRAAEVSELDRLKDFGVDVDIPTQPLSRADFLQRCGESRLVWSPEGRGWDCFRHYESAAAGSVPVINRAWMRQYAEFHHGQNAWFYQATDQPGELGFEPLENPLQGLFDTVVSALADKSRLSDMAIAAREHTLAHHTHQRIVDYVLETSDRLIAEQNFDDESHQAVRQSA